MKTINAYIHTATGTRVVKIQSVDVKMTEKAEEKMLDKFNRGTKALEWVGGTTYCIDYKGAPDKRFESGHKPSYRLKSNSLDELQVMYTAAYNGLPVPERKCFMFPKDPSVKPR